MKVITSPPVQQQLDALIDEAQTAGCVVEQIHLTLREYDALADAGKLELRVPVVVERHFNTLGPRMGTYRGYFVREVL